MGALLISINGGETRLFDAAFTVGTRGDLVIADEYASSRHARFTTDGTDWFVGDLGSTNGTYLNGTATFKIMALTARKPKLSKGDQVRIGHTVLTVVPVS